jgi:conjugative transfer pilus assembly protein TraH
MNMLVEKLQGILQNSAGIAFNMALDVVCPKCQNIMSTMEQMSNTLNGLAMNDCSMAKGMTTSLLSPAAAAAKDYLHDTVSDANKGGIVEGYKQAYKSLDAAATQTYDQAASWLNTQRGLLTGPDANKDYRMSGCPSETMEIFPETLTSPPKSMLEVSGIKLGLESEHIAVMRGLVGDVQIAGAADGYRISVIPACTNSQPSADSIKKGEYSKRGAGTNDLCVPVTGGNENLTKYVSDMMTSIASKMKSKTIITDGSAEANFIKNSPVPIAYALKVGIASGQDDVIIASLAEISSTALAVKSMSDLMARINAIMQTAEEQNHKVLNMSEKCNVGIHVINLKEKRESLYRRIAEVSKAYAEILTSEMNSYTNVVNLVQYLENMNKVLESDITSRFGASIATRAMR